MSGLLDPLLHAPAWAVLLVVGATVFAEDALFVGFVLPGETAAVLGGVSAELGHVSLVGVAVTVVLAAVLGDTVGYEVGRHLGPRIIASRHLDSRRAQIERGQDVLRRRGGTAVFLARWTAFLRAVMPALAGLSRMPYGRFLAFNAAGGLLWGLVVVAIGYLAGSSYATVEKTFGRGAGIAIAAVVVVALVVWRVRKHRHEAEEAEEAGGA